MGIPPRQTSVFTGLQHNVGELIPLAIQKSFEQQPISRRRIYDNFRASLDSKVPPRLICGLEVVS